MCSLSYVFHIVVVVDVFTCWKLEKVVPQSISVEGDDVLIPCSDLRYDSGHRRISCRYFPPKRLYHSGRYVCSFVQLA